MKLVKKSSQDFFDKQEKIHRIFSCLLFADIAADNFTDVPEMRGLSGGLFALLRSLELKRRRV